MFLLNISEFFYSNGENERAVELIKESRKILWKRIAKINYYILNDKEGYTKDKIINGLEIDPSLKSLLNDRENSLGLGIVDIKKKPDLAKKGETKSDYNSINYNSILNYKENEFTFNSEKVNKDINHSEEGHNLYFWLNDCVCKIDLKYLLFQLFVINKISYGIKLNSKENKAVIGNNSFKGKTGEIKTGTVSSLLKTSSNIFNNSVIKDDKDFESSDNIIITNTIKPVKEKRLNIDIINSILDDLEILFKNMLYPHISFRVILLSLRARMYKKKFIYDYEDFKFSEDFQNIAKKNKLEMDLITKEILIRITNNYSERTANVWQKYLSSAKENYEKAINHFKTIPNEFSLSFENNFSFIDIYLDLSDINLLMAQFSPNLNPKFTDISQIVNKINKINLLNKFYDEPNDELPFLPDNLLPPKLKEEKDNYIKERMRKDKIFHRSLIKNTIFMIEQTVKIYNTKKYILENMHDICITSLIDPSRLAKDLSAQIIENDFLNKKRNKNYLTNIVAKTAVDTFDVFNLFKNYIREVEYFTMNFNICDDQIKSVSKIHKFLRMNSTNYLNKCNYDVINPPQDIEDLNNELVKKDYIYVFMVRVGDRFSLNYILGANSSHGEIGEHLYGRFIVSHENLLKIRRNLLQLKTNFKNSSLLSEQKKNRDLKYLNDDYIKILIDISIEFMRGKSN
jgi:hypothetical protein